MLRNCLCWGENSPKYEKVKYLFSNKLVSIGFDGNSEKSHATNTYIVWEYYPVYMYK